MNDNNKNIDFNYYVNGTQDKDNNGQLFYDNKDNIFSDVNTEMISVTGINNIYSGNNSNMSLIVEKNYDYNNQNNNIVENDIMEKKEDINKRKNNIFSILTNQKILLWITIFIFIFTSITVGKTIYLRSMVDGYKDFFVEIEKKESMETIIYQDEEILNDSLKNIAASEYINCINSALNINNLPDSINSIVKEINNYYNQSNNYFAFKYKDIYTGFSISYNENQKIFTASTIKAPKDIYIYEMASMGKINLDDKLVYSGKYANTGAWVLKNKNFNTKHSVRELVKYSTVSSDNAAHNMLMDHFGRGNMLSFWQGKGTNAIFTANNNWGVTSAHDASIYMEELYKFYLENETYGEELMNIFLNANPKFIKGKDNYKVANKSGWAGSAIHDVSIVFADNPYIVVALSNLGETDYYMSYFNKANDFAYRLHTEYWKYKMSICENINQY